MKFQCCSKLCVGRKPFENYKYEEDKSMIIKIVSWDNVLEAQWKDVEIDRIRATLGIEEGIPFRIMENGLLMIGKWICIPKNSMLKKEILEGAHWFCFTSHTWSIKMYID